MRILLDTHIFLWFIDGDSRLPATARNAIVSGQNTVYLSAASVWEVIIKNNLGKLPLPEPPELLLPRQRRLHGIRTLLINEQTVLQLAHLPLFHRDPFDRILICQALQHNLTIATVDPAFKAYPVNLL